jgi:hypothetical protein
VVTASVAAARARVRAIARGKVNRRLSLRSRDKVNLRDSLHRKDKAKVNPRDNLHLRDKAKANPRDNLHLKDKAKVNPRDNLHLKDKAKVNPRGNLHLRDKVRPSLSRRRKTRAMTHRPVSRAVRHPTPLNRHRGRGKERRSLRHPACRPAMPMTGTWRTIRARPAK